MNQVILVSASWISYNSKILKKFNSLKDEFSEINFVYFDFDQNREKINFQIEILPTWKLYIKEQERILTGDVLIKPIRFAIRNLIKG